MCFLHADNAVSRRQFIQQVSVGAAAAAALAGVGPKLALAAEGIDAQGVGDPDTVVPAATADPNRVIDGFSKVLQNRWNQDLAPVAKGSRQNNCSSLADLVSPWGERMRAGRRRS
jgi:hypothetical protein